MTLTEESEGSRRFGDGRALFASYDPAARRALVATTVGLVVQLGANAPTTLTQEMATMLAVSPDDRYAALTTSAGHLQVWDLSTQEQVASFDVAPDRFRSLDFAGAAVVAASATEVFRFGVDGTATELLVMPAETRLGPVVVAATGDVAAPVNTPVPSVATWSPSGMRDSIALGLPEGTRLTGVRWSSDATQLAVLYAPPSAGDGVGIWDVSAGRFTGRVDLPNFVEPHQVAFPTSDRIVLPNSDRVVAYDLAGGEVGSFPTGGSPVSAIDVSGGATVVSRLDGTLTRWRVGEDPTELSPRTSTLVDHRGGTAVAVVDQVGLVRMFSAEGADLARLDRWAVGEATAVDVATDGSLVLATSTGAVRVLSPSGRNVMSVLDRRQGEVSDLSVDPKDGLIATGVSVQKGVEAWDDTIEVSALETESSVFSLGGEAENVTGCAFYDATVVFSPDGTLLASTSHDFTVQISPLTEPEATTVLKAHAGSVLDVDFSPDGSTMLTSADDSTMRAWKIDGWQLRTELTTSPGGWYSMAYSPDGSLLAVSDAAGQISLIDQTTGRVERTFSGVRSSLGDMVFTPDGQSLVAPEPNGSVGIWNVATGTLVRELLGHTMPVNGLAISADGATVVTASQDGTVREFALTTG